MGARSPANPVGSFVEGIQTGAQWAELQANIDFRREQARLAQEQLKIQKNEYQEKVSSKLMEDASFFVFDDNKSRRLKKFNVWANRARQLGVPIDPNVEDLIKDDETVAQVQNSFARLGSLNPEVKGKAFAQLLGLLQSKEQLSYALNAGQQITSTQNQLLDESGQRAAAGAKTKENFEDFLRSEADKQQRAEGGLLTLETGVNKLKRLLKENPGKAVNQAIAIGLINTLATGTQNALQGAEISLYSDTRGLLESFSTYLEKLKAGERLGPEQEKQFVEAADLLAADLPRNFANVSAGRIKSIQRRGSELGLTPDQLDQRINEVVSPVARQYAEDFIKQQRTTPSDTPGKRSATENNSKSEDVINNFKQALKAARSKKYSDEEIEEYFEKQWEGVVGRPMFSSERRKIFGKEGE